LAILQAPTNWSEALLLSGPTAAAVVLVYHIANAYRISVDGRHLDAVSGSLIVGTPYAVGGLLLLRSDGLLQSSFGSVFAGRGDHHALAGGPVGRSLSDHRYAHGRHPRPGAVRGFDVGSPDSGNEEGDDLQRHVHDDAVRHGHVGRTGFRARRDGLGSPSYV